MGKYLYFKRKKTLHCQPTLYSSAVCYRMNKKLLKFMQEFENYDPAGGFET
jgi:hypothetical protein